MLGVRYFIPEGRRMHDKVVIVDRRYVVESSMNLEYYRDGDFYCLIEHFEKQNKLLKLIIPNQHDFSSLLRKFALHMLFMNGLKNKLEYKKR